MSIHMDSVAYQDPTQLADILSASPVRNGGKNYGTISVTHGSDFEDTQYDKRGKTQSVCVKPGDELTVLRKLGDRLRGIAEDDDNVTIVVTRSQLMDLLTAASFGEAKLRDVAGVIVDLLQNDTSFKLEPTRS